MSVAWLVDGSVQLQHRLSNARLSLAGLLDCVSCQGLYCLINIRKYISVDVAIQKCIHFSITLTHQLKSNTRQLINARIMHSVLFYSRLAQIIVPALLPEGVFLFVVFISRDTAKFYNKFEVFFVTVTNSF